MRDLHPLVPRFLVALGIASAVAITTGGRAFAVRVIPGLILMVAAARLGAFIAGPIKIWVRPPMP